MTLDLRLERWVPARPERVFDAFTDITQLRSWFTCDPASTWTFHTWDATVGGRLRVTISGDGYALDVNGRFVTVEAPHRLAYDWDDELVELDFSDADGGTLVRLHHRRLETDTDVQIRHGGWTHNLGSLADHLTTAKDRA